MIQNLEKAFRPFTINAFYIIDDHRVLKIKESQKNKGVKSAVDSCYTRHSNSNSAEFYGLSVKRERKKDKQIIFIMRLGSNLDL